MTPRCFVAIGDSFTAGIDPAARPWPDLIGALLPGCRYSNFAVAGARSGEVRAHQLEPAISLRPDLASVICGANDVVRTTRPDIGSFAVNFNHILVRLRTECPETRLVTATYPPITDYSPLRARTRARVTGGLEQVNAIVRRLSAEHGASCLELADHPAREVREHLAEDGFHPSASGHEQAALAFSACLRDELGIDLELDLEEAA